jgi:guanylate kinase
METQSHTLSQLSQMTSSCDGILFVLVGPSGVGKNTIMQELLKSAAIPGLRQMPTATTRGIRPGEIAGVHHDYITVEEFKRMIAANDLFEYQEVDPGKFYGVPRHPLVKAMTEDHERLIADIEVRGAAILKRELPAHVILIYIEPPDFNVLEQRIRNRGGADEAEIQQRLERSRREMAFADQCDYRVVNDKIENALPQVIARIREVLTARGCD